MAAHQKSSPDDAFLFFLFWRQTVGRVTLGAVAKAYPTCFYNYYYYRYYH